MNTVVRKVEDDGSFTYHSPSELGLGRMRCNVLELMGHTFDDGMGSEITGIQILNGLASMVEKTWAGEFVMPLDDDRRI